MILYKITNTLNNKVYVGQTRRTEEVKAKISATLLLKNRET